MHSELFQQISDICAAVNVAMTPKYLLEISLKKTMELFNAKRGSIFILSENGRELTMQIARGMKTEEQENMVKRLGEGVVGKVAEIKKPIVVEDISNDERFPGHRSRQSYQTPSFICAPLMLKDKLIGVINIADKECGTKFDRYELQLLDFLSSQMALNYRRIELYQKFRRLIKESQSLKDELGRTSEVTSKLRKQVDIHERLASIGKLTGGIAHELNNPLDGVLRFVNLSLEKLPEDDELIRDYLLEAKHGLNSMVNIVRSLLACSREAPASLQKIDINMAVSEALSILRSEFYQKNIVLKKDLGENLPKIIDFGLDRIAENLLRNAIDAVPDGGEIAVSTRFQDQQIIFEVADSGCGIDKEKIEKIFDPFYTTKDMGKGCGLGLTIVGEVVKCYDGDIDVVSEPTKRTVFTIKLPTENQYADAKKL